MRQETDIARMAAASKTPSLRYRSFSNAPIRNPLPAPRPPEDPDFSVLGDALSGLSDLPPDRVMNRPVPAVMPETDTYPVAPDPHTAPVRITVLPPHPTPPVLPLADPSPGQAPVTPVRMEAGTGFSLLDALTGFDATVGEAPIHYPLLDGLGDALRGTDEEPPSRRGPAVRVDTALPEMLRRLATRIRLASRTA